MKSSVSSAARPGPSAYWKRNLAFIWISQFVAMMGFSYGLPFVAYFMQTDLHVSQSDLPFWQPVGVRFLAWENQCPSR